MLIRSLIVFFLLPLSLTFSYAQKVNNVRAQKDGDYVKILYDLEAEDPNDNFNVEILASHNNFTSPLRMVTGDIGENVKPGKDKTVIWRPVEELENFTGEITFEVRATLMGSYYRINQPSSYSKFKRKKIMPIRWDGGQPGENVRIVLTRLGSNIETITENTSNSGTFNWTIPKSVSKGKGYQVQIVNTRDYTLEGTSKTFKIKGGFPAAVAILTPIVIGGGVAAYLFLGEDEPVNGGNGGNDLPDPPDAPNQ